MGCWMNYWLFKSEPDVFSFADLKRKGREPWTGVRNYQARNFMRDSMTKGDLGLFYHSSCAEPGVAGMLQVVSECYADPTQFETGGEYFERRATVEKPVWMLVDVGWKGDFKKLVSLAAMRKVEDLAEMRLLQKGSRLSITPVTEVEFRTICGLGANASG